MLHGTVLRMFDEGSVDDPEVGGAREGGGRGEARKYVVGIIVGLRMFMSPPT